jgi:hypothetical protein
MQQMEACGHSPCFGYRGQTCELRLVLAIGVRPVSPWCLITMGNLGMHSVLALKPGVTVHLHHPGVVTLSGNGRWELATTWDHYHFVLDGDYGTAQGPRKRHEAQIWH